MGRIKTAGFIRNSSAAIGTSEQSSWWLNVTRNHLVSSLFCRIRPQELNFKMVSGKTFKHPKKLNRRNIDSQMPNTVKPQNVTIFFGQKHQETLKEFDELSNSLRRSRTGTLHFLLTHYKWYEKHRLVSL